MKFKPSLFQKISSWLLPYNIETVESKVSGKLEVNLQYGSIVIDSPDANYSFGNLHLVFREAIEHLNLDFSKQYKVLILGFGAGSIAHILKNEIMLNCGITGIELDEEIIELSKKYFSPSIFKRTNIHYTDALEFISTNTDYYDLVFVDLFIDTKIPKVFQQTDFLSHLKNSISTNGQILMNTMSENEKVKANWKTVFDSCTVISVQDNEVLISANKPA